MPTAWLGSWYQHGMNSLLEITIDHIQTKGVCLDVLPIQQYYLFTDRLHRCTRCLLFIQRHINLLQYRESECIDLDDLININSCPNMIAPDATLYTLHRNNSKPELCPIQPPFILTNLIKDGSICHQSILSSHINECANNYQFHLHLSPCSSYQSIIDFQFICVGTWIIDFHTYFVTRILSHSVEQQQHNHLNNQYACFRFLTKQKSSSSSSSLLLHMATDDSCHDLYSKHMSTIITLSPKNYQMINESCVFPKEFQLYEWYSINRTIQMFIRNNNIEFIGINKRFYCQKILHIEKSIYIYRIQSYTNCYIKEECLQIIQRTNNVLEFYTVPLSKDNSCSYLNTNNYNFYLTFLTKKTNLCPNYIGNLIFQSNIDYYLKKNKSFYMSIGCNDKQKIIISKKDNNIKNYLIIQSDTCLASWISNDLLTTYLIAQSKYSNASYCLSFQMTNPIIIRNNSNGCLFDNNNNENSISIYSAYITHPCSKSEKLSLKSILLLLIIIFIFIRN